MQDDSFPAAELIQGSPATMLLNAIGIVLLLLGLIAANYAWYVWYLKKTNQTWTRNRMRQLVFWATSLDCLLIARGVGPPSFRAIPVAVWVTVGLLCVLPIALHLGRDAPDGR